MPSRCTLIRFVLFPAALFSPAGLFPTSPVHAAAPGDESANTLAVPDEHASLGVVHHIEPGRDAQVAVASDAPLMRMTAISRGVIGYAVLAERDSRRQPDLLAGQVRMPAESLRTNLPQRDALLHSSRWLDAREHPEVILTITGSKNVQPARDADWFTEHTAELLGQLSIRGARREVRIPARLTLMPESDRTRFRGPGDWLVIRSEFRVNLREFGLNDPLISVGRLAETVRVDLALFLTTAEAVAQP